MLFPIQPTADIRMAAPLPQLLYGSDLFVMPSIFEGLPVTLIEAQCAGLPAILSSSITREGNCGVNSVKYLDLVPQKWVECILRSVQIKKADIAYSTKLVSESGFDVAKNALSLKKMYEGIFDNVN